MDRQGVIVFVVIDKFSDWYTRATSEISPNFPGNRVDVVCTFPKSHHSYEAALVLIEVPGHGDHSKFTITDIKKHCPHARLVALSVRPDSKATYLGFGVDDFIDALLPPRQIVDAIRAQLNLARD